MCVCVGVRVCVRAVQLAGVSEARRHGGTGRQEEEPAEDKATMAATGHPSNPADTS